MSTATGYVHEAVLYEGDAGFLAAMVPFIRDGLDAEEPVFVVVPEPKVRLLRDALGRDADRVEFADMSVVGRNPSCILAVWEDFAARHPGRRLRGIGEPAFAGRSHLELDECYRHEAVLNVAVDPELPLWLVCPYDVAGLDAEVIDRAHETHPHVHAGGVVAPSPRYRGDALPTVVFGGPPTDPPEGAATVVVRDAAGRELRSFVASEAEALGADPARIDDIVLAVTELVANSIRHGGGSGRLSLWREPGYLACEVRDAGWIRAAAAGRRLPSASRPDGRGLWLVNQFSDLVQVRSAPGATSVTARWAVPD